MKRRLRIATNGVAADYYQSLVPLILKQIGYQIEWVPAAKADMIIFGPFFRQTKNLRWVPRPLRPRIESWIQSMQLGHRPLTLFQTAENLRYDHVPCDYALSFDLAVDSVRHRRFPYWFEMVDWQHEGVRGNGNPRFGKLLQIDRLARPLGRSFLRKPHKAAIFASHLREPRTTLLRAMQRLLPVEGYGPVFNTAVLHHSTSGFTKFDVLQGFAFNLCPENSMYPGYYTEKIPEAFMADCLPLTWTDDNVVVDFNPNAFVNLAPMMANEFQDLSNLLLSQDQFGSYAEQPLLLNRPTLIPIIEFLRNVAAEACS